MSISLGQIMVIGLLGFLLFGGLGRRTKGIKSAVFKSLRKVGLQTPVASPSKNPKKSSIGSKAPSSYGKSI